MQRTLCLVFLRVLIIFSIFFILFFHKTGQTQEHSYNTSNSQITLLSNFVSVNNHKYEVDSEEKIEINDKRAFELAQKAFSRRRNDPPYSVTLLYPPNNANWEGGIALPEGNITFSWRNNGDPEGDPLWFYLYLIKWNANQKRWFPHTQTYTGGRGVTTKTLMLSQGYYAWQVAAVDETLQSKPWYQWSDRDGNGVIDKRDWSFLMVSAPGEIPKVAEGESTISKNGKCQDFLFRLWNRKSCQLLTKLRDKEYFNIPYDKISDYQLLKYIQENESNIEALILQIDYGRDIDRFAFKNQTKHLEHEKEFIQALNKAKGLLTTVRLIVLFLEKGGPAINVVSESLSVLSTIIEGIRVYKLAVNIFTYSRTKEILKFYILDRHSLDEGKADLSKETAWDAIVTGFGQQLEDISFRTGITEELDVWFENAFVAYRLVGYSDSDSIRYAQGVALASGIR